MHMHTSNIITLNSGAAARAALIDKRPSGMVYHETRAHCTISVNVPHSNPKLTATLPPWCHSQHAVPKRTNVTYRNNVHNQQNADFRGGLGESSDKLLKFYFLNCDQNVCLEMFCFQ